MGKPPPNVKADIKRLQNPYAWTQIDGFVDDEERRSCGREAERVVAQARSVPNGAQPSTTAAKSALFATAAEQPRREHPSGNPYHSLANLESDEPEMTTTREGTGAGFAIDGTVTQSEFVRWFRRLFNQYMPALERDRLRPEYRDFIERNKGRSARSRFRLIQAMQRYDLSGLALSPQFNRESEVDTVRKLRDIEKEIGEDGK